MTERYYFATSDSIFALTNHSVYAELPYFCIQAVQKGTQNNGLTFPLPSKWEEQLCYKSLTLIIKISHNLCISYLLMNNLMFGMFDVQQYFLLIPNEGVLHCT
jgi:hypothetical protein